MAEPRFLDRVGLVATIIMKPAGMPTIMLSSW